VLGGEAPGGFGQGSALPAAVPEGACNLRQGRSLRDGWLRRKPAWGGRRLTGPASLHGLDPDSAGPSDASLARDPGFAGLLARSYRHRLGVDLAPSGPDAGAAARWLYERAPFCLLVHNTAADPRFVYANRAAQACFGYGWDEMTRLRSRQSAGPQDRAERQALIEAVARDGFATGYRGLRVARSGRRFWIEDVTMWQLVDAAGVLRGQAAAYGRWTDA
jgi:PAS domain S-box-containing protein